jgi:ligand-binding SRPBCC domain-containing protein
MSVEIVTTPRGYALTTAITIPRPRDEVFAFFADAFNLERITPPLLRFHVLTPAPIEMRQGAIIDYALRLRRVPIRWRTEITAWEPPVRFVDEQKRGPYRRWVHEHRFTDLGSDTLVEDRVEYAVPGGRLVHALFVRRDVREIFRHRTEALRALLG